MLAVVGGLFGGGKLMGFGIIAMIVVLLAGLGTIKYQSWRIASLKQDIAEIDTQRAKALAEAKAAEEIANANAATIRRLTADYAASRIIADKLLVEEQKRAASALTRARQLQKEIADAKPTDDGPCAPVLCRTLERLREWDRAAGSHPNPR